jgi:putative tryptophan/tyrosine transport system substrate-binding protein
VGRRQYVAELINARPDLLVTGTGRLTREMQQQTNTVPIIFVGAGDPLTLGIVASLARPEGNTTGVTDIFPSIAAKWLELLKEAVPDVSRVALIFSAEAHTTYRFGCALGEDCERGRNAGWDSRHHYAGS